MKVTITKIMPVNQYLENTGYFRLMCPLSETYTIAAPPGNAGPVSMINDPSSLHLLYPQVVIETFRINSRIYF